jgi:hypothetical protein
VFSGAASPASPLSLVGSASPSRFDGEADGGSPGEHGLFCNSILRKDEGVEIVAPSNRRLRHRICS